MRIYDISRGIFASPLYPDTRLPELHRVKDIACGDDYNLSELTLDLHTATHADACSHFIECGATIDRMDLGRYVGRCSVFDMTGRRVEDLPDAETEILLMRCAPYLSTEDCRAIVAKGYRTVGVDTLSPASAENETLVHRLLLGAGMAIIESLDLSGIDEGEYFLSAAPLKIEDAEAAPLRAVLIDFNS